MKTRSKTASTNRQRNTEGMDTDLHEAFLDELADMYNAEGQITKALPKMIKTAESEELKEAFQAHLEETENQIERLEQVFKSLGEKVRGKTCEGLKGILKEGEEVMKEQKGTSAFDAVLIAGAQKVEHYEIASYGTLIAWAEAMGHQDAVRLFEESLEEEKAADKKLTTIACEIANQHAQSR